MVIRLKKLLSVLLGILLIVLGLLFLLYGVSALKNKETPATDSPKQITQAQAPAEQPMIALTFDDGPYGPVTSRILDALQKENGKATFFIVGSRIAGREETVKKIAAAGCEIGNHTYDHVTLRGLNDAQVLDQLQKDDEALKKVVGHESTLLRPPGGIYEKHLLTLTDKPIVLWTIDTMDWSHQNKDITVKRVLDNVEDGDIILMHDLFPATADAVEELVPELTKRGFQLVTVSELIAARREPDGVVLRQSA